MKQPPAADRLRKRHRPNQDVGHAGAADDAIDGTAVGRIAVGSAAHANASLIEWSRVVS